MELKDSKTEKNLLASFCRGVPGEKPLFLTRKGTLPC